MKKLFSFLVLLAAAVGAHATTDTLLTYTITEADYGVSGTYLQAGAGTIYYGVAKTEASTVAPSGYAYKLDGNASSSNTKYVLLTLAEGTTFQAGDTIALQVFCASSPSESKPYGVGIYTELGDASTRVDSFLCSAKNTVETYTYVVEESSAFVGKSAVYIQRNTAYSTYFCSATITREATSTEGEGNSDSGSSDGESGDTIDIPDLPTTTSLTISPKNGSTVNELSTFTVTLNDYSTVNYTKTIYVYTDAECTTNATTSSGGTVYASPSVNGNVITIDLGTRAISTAGVYYTKIVADKLIVDGSSGSSIGDIIVTYVVDPDAVIEEDTTNNDTEEEEVTYTIKSITIADGDTLESLKSGATLQFSIEPNAKVGYAFTKIGTTAGGADTKSRSTLSYNSTTGYWEQEVYNDISLTSGTYYLTVTAYATENDYNYDNAPLISDTITFTGSAAAYEYSTAKIESVSPENEASISSKEELSVTLTFSGAVKVDSNNSFANYGQGVTYDFASITSSDGAEYSKTWTLTVSANTLSYFEDGIDLTVVATDESGARVYDETLSEGEDDYTYIHLYYEFGDVGLTAFTITPAEGTVDSLSTFTLTYDGATNIAPTWNYYPTLYDAEGNTVEAINGNNVTYTTSEVVFALASNVTTAGTYTLAFPKKTVNIDDDVDKYNAELTYTYTIEEIEEEDTTDTTVTIPTLSTLYNLTVNPENGSTVKSISSFTVTFNDYSTVNSTSYPIVYSDTDYTTQVTYCKPSANGNTLTLTASAEVTDSGTYYIVIKSGKVNLDNSTSISENIVVTYTVDPNTVEENTEEEEDSVVTYTMKLVTPEEGDSLESMASGYTLQFEIEPAEKIGYAYYKIGTTADGGDLVSRTSLTYNSTTQYWEGEVYYDVSLEEGTIYITAAAYATEDDYNYGNDALVKDTFVIIGTAAEYEYSTIAVESVSPENESSIASKEPLEVTITFSGNVKLSSETTFINYGQGVLYDFASIKSIDGAEYSSSWTLTVSTGTMSDFEDGIDLTIVAIDENGARVYDETLSEGEDDYTYIHLYYEFNDVGLTDFTITPAEGTVESLSTFTLTYEGAENIAPTWNYYPTLYDADDNVVEAITGKNTSYTTSEVVFALSSEVTNAGTYKLVIPKKTVNINDDVDSYNAELTYTYTIGSSSTEDGNGDSDGDGDDNDDGTTGINGIAADSNGNFTVYSISGIRVMITDNAADVKNLPTGLYIVNGKKTAVK